MLASELVFVAKRSSSLELPQPSISKKTIKGITFGAQFFKQQLIEIRFIEVQKLRIQFIKAQEIENNCFIMAHPFAWKLVFRE